MDYIRIESLYYYDDINDYFAEIDQCSDEIKAKRLSDLVLFIADVENLNEEEFKRMLI